MSERLYYLQNRDRSVVKEKIELIKMVVAATGFFDGVHLGHQTIIDMLYKTAKDRGAKSAIITFWPHPRTVLQQDAADLRLLSSLEEKRELVLSKGIDETIVIPFSKNFSNLTTREFVKEFLIDRCNVSLLIVGYDHKLGCDAIQTQEEMIKIVEEMGVECIRVEEFLMGDSLISSTKIRNLLSLGNIVDVNRSLGYRYGLKGVVVSGAKIGRTIGFPTANMKLYEPLKLIPANGVYVVWVEVLSKTYLGITNIGMRPTIGEGKEQSIETHIIDFDEDIYGLDIKIEFVDKIRNESLL